MPNKLKDLIDIVQFRLKINQEDVAKRLGYSRGHLSSLIKSNDEATIKKMFIEFGDILERDGAKSYPESAYLETIAELSRTGVNMSESNKDISAASKETALANRILAENQKELLYVVRALARPMTNGGKEIPLVSLSDPLRELMSARGIVLQLWKSMDEGLQVLDRLVAGDVPIKSE